KWIILLTILIVFANSSSFFDNDVFELKLHESYNDEVKVHNILWKCLHVALLSTQKYQLFLNLIIRNSDTRCEAKNQLIMEIHCVIAMNISKNILDNIDQKYFICIQLWLTSDSNENNTLFTQNFLSELEKKKFEPKIRHIRDVLATKTSLKLSEHKITIKNITPSLPINAMNTTYFPLAWMQDYNDSTWTKSNKTISNVTILLPSTKLPIKRKDDLIFGYFQLYALILLAIFGMLLLAITAIACYFDCENRRSYLPGTRYNNIKRDTIPTVTIKYADKKPDIMHEKKIQKVMAAESLVHSRTLRKRKMLIEAQQHSASTQSISEFGKSAMTEKDRMRLLRGIKTKLSDVEDAELTQSDITKDTGINAMSQVAEMKRLATFINFKTLENSEAFCL
ncbi:hypothetical protein X798_00803, partial [Onchocerca flexuosa]